MEHIFILNCEEVEYLSSLLVALEVETPEGCRGLSERIQSKMMESCPDHG